MEYLTEDVILLVLEELYNQQNGVKKLAHFERTSKKAARLVQAYFSRNLKKLIITSPKRIITKQAPKSTSTSISINGCRFRDGQASRYDFDQQPVFLDSFHECLYYLLSRASVITQLVTRGFFKFPTRIPQFNQIAEDLTSCPKVLLETLCLTPFWSQLLTGVLINNSSALKKLLMRTNGIDRPLEKLYLTLDKFILDISLTDAEDQQHRLKNLFDFLIEGESRAENLIIKGSFAASMYGQEDTIFTSLIQQFAPSSLIWNGIVLNYCGFGKVEDGDITQPGSWLEIALRNGIVMEHLHFLNIRQAYLQNWGQTPFNFVNLKQCFPNLQELSISSPYQTDPLAEIARVRQFITDLFANWHTLDATADFRFMRPGKHGVVIDFTEEQKDIVLNEKSVLESTLTNLAFIRTCTRVHHHLHPKLEVVSTGKARVLLEFIVSACNPGDLQPIRGVAGTVHCPREEDRCTFLCD